MNKETWIIVVDNNDVDGVDMYLFDGTFRETLKQVKEKAKTIKEEDRESYEYTICDARANSKPTNCIEACVQFDNYHVDIIAKTLSSLNHFCT